MAFLQIPGGQGAQTTMALHHLLTPECQEETYTVPEQADALAEHAFQCLIPKARHHFSSLSGAPTKTHIRMVEGCCVRKQVAAAHFLESPKTRINPPNG